MAAEAAPAGLPSFSIIIPTRNEAADLRQTLERVLALDYPKREVIVVDD